MSNRDRQVHFLVNEAEWELIKQKMEESGIKNIGVYLRRMAIMGYTIKLDLDDMKEAIRLLRIMGNNMNQYAKKANETGNIYAEDIKDIKARQEELWQVMKAILDKLAGI